MEKEPIQNPEEAYDFVAVDFERASGKVICSPCDQPYLRHPWAEEYLNYQDQPYLRRLCDGTLVKL